MCKYREVRIHTEQGLEVTEVTDTLMDATDQVSSFLFCPVRS